MHQSEIQHLTEKQYSMKSKLLEDALGSMLHKFFTECARTHETDECLVSMLWHAVSHYRTTGEFSIVIIVCPQYNHDYTEVLSGVSVTARRAISLFFKLKKYMKRHIRYTKKVNFRLALFDQEHRQFDHMGLSYESAEKCMQWSVRDMQLRLRKKAILPDSFSAGLLVGQSHQQEWERLFSISLERLKNGEFDGTEPFEHPDIVFAGMRKFYIKVTNTDDAAVHRKMFETEEGPGYLAAGHLLRGKYGPHTIQIDVGSDSKLARLNLWQPPGEKLTDHPALIRIKDPHIFDGD